MRAAEVLVNEWVPLNGGLRRLGKGRGSVLHQPLQIEPGKDVLPRRTVNRRVEKFLRVSPEPAHGEPRAFISAFCSFRRDRGFIRRIILSLIRYALVPEPAACRGVED